MKKKIVIAIIVLALLIPVIVANENLNKGVEKHKIVLDGYMDGYIPIRIKGYMWIGDPLEILFEYHHGDEDYSLTSYHIVSLGEKFYVYEEHTVETIKLNLNNTNYDCEVPYKVVLLEIDPETGFPHTGEIWSDNLASSEITIPPNSNGWFSFPIDSVTLSANTEYAIMGRVSGGSVGARTYLDYNTTFEGDHLICRTFTPEGWEWTYEIDKDIHYEIWGFPESKGDILVE